jgi:hypothetical protein
MEEIVSESLIVGLLCKVTVTETLDIPDSCHICLHGYIDINSRARSSSICWEFHMILATLWSRGMASRNSHASTV